MFVFSFCLLDTVGVIGGDDSVWPAPNRNLLFEVFFSQKGEQRQKKE